MFTTTSTYSLPEAVEQSTASFKDIATTLAKVFASNEFTKSNYNAHRSMLKFLYSLEGEFGYPAFVRAAKLKYAPNTIVQLSISLKQLCKLAKIELNTAGVRVKSIITQAFHLNEKELDMLRKHKYFDERQQKCADIFILLSYTGCRFSDYTKIKYKDGENVCSVTQTKTKTSVYLPIHDYAKKILKKYNGEMPVVSISFFDKWIKMSCVAAGIGDKAMKVSSHGGRRSFSTNLYERKVDPVTIMAVTGHKDVSSFLRYVRSSQVKHATMINDVWRNKK